MDSTPRKETSEELGKDFKPKDPGLKKSPPPMVRLGKNLPGGAVKRLYHTGLDKFRQPEMMAMRKEVVLFAERYSQTAAAEKFGLSRNTVMKWVHRYRVEGVEGLQDRRQGPKVIPHKLSQQEEDEIKRARQAFPFMGARRLRLEFRWSYAVDTIHRVLRQAGLIETRRTRHRVSRDLRAAQAGEWAPGQFGQIDVMYLTDHPSCVDLALRHPLARLNTSTHTGML